MLAIIMAIENDDDRHFAEDLYYAYNQPMFRIAKAILKDENKAEDAVADTFERIIKSLDKFRDSPCNKTRGLIVIYTRNVCFNILKREKTIEFSELNEEILQDDISTEDFVVSNAAYNELIKIISVMEDKYRDVMRLKYNSDFTDAEIANLLGITQENVRVRIHRAKAMLRKKLKEVVYDGK